MNPRIKDFLEKKPDLTVIGLFWAGYWRLLAVVYGTVIAIWFVVIILTALFS